MYDTLILSGGSVKGVAFLGAMRYLEEKEHHNFKIYVGTSIGSVINYLLILNYTPLEIVHRLCNSPMFEQLRRLNLVAVFKNEGVISFNPVYDELELLTLEKLNDIPTLKELYECSQKRYVACTFNATKCIVEYIDYQTHPDLSCLEAIRMDYGYSTCFSQGYRR